MAGGVNKVILIGNLGQDPETRFTAGGAAVCKISVATSEEWKDKQSGEKQSRVEWNKCVAFGRLAEIMGEYLKKGSQVYIEGSLRTNKYQAQDGTDRYSTEIVVKEMQMLGGKGEGGGQRGSSGGQRSSAPAQSRMPDPETDFNDDIPF